MSIPQSYPIVLDGLDKQTRDNFWTIQQMLQKNEMAGDLTITGSLALSDYLTVYGDTSLSTLTASGSSVFSSTVTISGLTTHSGNIKIGANYISYDGTNAGISINSSNKVYTSGALQTGGLITSGGNIYVGSYGLGNNASVLTFGTGSTGLASFGGAVTVGGLLTCGGNIKLGVYYLSGDGDNEGITIDSSGNITASAKVGIGLSPTSKITIAAGTNSAGTAPLKLTSGTNLSTPEAGAIEFDGTNLYYTDSTPTRQTISKNSTFADYLKVDQTTPQTTTGTFSFPSEKIGDSSNYTNFASDGELNLIGTARVYIENQLDFTGIGKGTSAPTEVRSGNYFGYAFTINDDGFTTFEIPLNWDSNSPIDFYIHWYINEAYATHSGEIRWQINWSATNEDGVESILSPTHSSTVNGNDENIPASANILMETKLTVSAANFALDDLVGIQIKRIALVDGSNPTAEPVVISLEYGYISNKLGKAT